MLSRFHQASRRRYFNQQKSNDFQKPKRRRAADVGARAESCGFKMPLDFAGEEVQRLLQIMRKSENGFGKDSAPPLVACFFKCALA